MFEDFNRMTVFSNGTHNRTLVGMALKDGHKCFFHVKPCAIPVYMFTDTNNSLFSPSEWCRDEISANGYEPTTQALDTALYCECIHFYKTLYVLKLEGGKWYVGITSDIERRLEQHRSGIGAKWTAAHKFEQLESSEDFLTPLPSCQAAVRENRKVYELVALYGMDSVRGGNHSAYEL
jgi:predicted GIY-YIG superfamily endonuclease